MVVKGVGFLVPWVQSSVGTNRNSLNKNEWKTDSGYRKNYMPKVRNSRDLSKKKKLNTFSLMISHYNQPFFSSHPLIIKLSSLCCNWCQNSIKTFKTISSNCFLIFKYVNLMKIMSTFSETFDFSMF